MISYLVVLVPSRGYVHFHAFAKLRTHYCEFISVAIYDFVCVLTHLNNKPLVDTFKLIAYVNEQLITLCYECGMM